MAMRHESSYPNPELQALVADVEEVATDAYSQVASDRSLNLDDIHVQNVCGPVTNYMIPALRERGYVIHTDRGERHMARIGWLYDAHGKPLPIEQQPEDSARIHRFPVIDTDGTDEGEVVADATWQQFLSDEQLQTPGLPKVLVGTRHQVRQQLESWGFTDPDLLRIWEKPERPNKPKLHSIK